MLASPTRAANAANALLVDLRQNLDFSIDAVAVDPRLVVRDPIGTHPHRQTKSLTETYERVDHCGV
jgi:hypothetical protein